jgi:hypothetical protein
LRELVRQGPNYRTIRVFAGLRNCGKSDENLSIR